MIDIGQLIFDAWEAGYTIDRAGHTTRIYKRTSEQCVCGIDLYPNGTAALLVIHLDEPQAMKTEAEMRETLGIKPLDLNRRESR